MQRLTVKSSHGDYSVVAQPEALTDLQSLLRREDHTDIRSVVTNTTVAPLWAEASARSLGAPLLELVDGEQHKRWSTVEDLLGRWLEAGLHRGDTVAAIGGGVLTDPFLGNGAGENMAHPRKVHELVVRGLQPFGGAFGVR